MLISAPSAKSGKLARAPIRIILELIPPSERWLKVVLTLQPLQLDILSNIWKNSLRRRIVLVEALMPLVVEKLHSA